MKGFLYIFAFLLIPYFGIAQKSVEKMRTEASKAKKEIEQTTKLLKETEKNKNASVEKLVLINQQITVRTQYLASLNEEIHHLEKEIAKSSVQLKTLNAQLSQLQEEYKQTLFTLYKVRSSYDQLIFIMSAENYNQAYNRIQYLQYYSDYMIKQANRIKLIQDSIQGHMVSLNKLLTQKQELIGIEKVEAQKLSNDKHQEDLMIQELSSKQQELKKKIEAKKLYAKKLNNQIEDLIRAEVKAQAAKKAKADAAAKAKASKATPAKPGTTAVKTAPAKPATTESTLTPEESLISKSFVENKGRLPWPTTSGKITERFGTHPHPTLNIDVESNGIEITTIKGAKARAIFEGTVAKVVVIPGRNTAVLIKHGSYYSVYDNLVNVMVKQGQHVAVKQEIGTIYTDTETGSTVLQLQIWKELQKLDPQLWLSK